MVPKKIQVRYDPWAIVCQPVLLILLKSFYLNKLLMNNIKQYRSQSDGDLCRQKWKEESLKILKCSF